MARDPQGCKNWLRGQIRAAGGNAQAVETVRGRLSGDPFALNLLPQAAAEMGISVTAAAPAPPPVPAAAAPPKPAAPPAPAAAPRPAQGSITAPQRVRGSGSAAPQLDEVSLR